MSGIYIHIPFCKQACYYCDFHFSTSFKTKDEMLVAMIEELNQRRDFLDGEPIQTIYIGGGTPSVIDNVFIERIINEIHVLFDTKNTLEITLEANPDDLTKEKLLFYKDLGINRLSIGIQSFDDKVLKYLNRVHDSTKALKSIHQAHDLGFNNISIDLIYGIPNTDMEYWQKQLHTLAQLPVQHLSSYCMTIEPKTVFGNHLKNNKLIPVDEEIAVDQFEYLIDYSAQIGFEQYEISNFCKNDMYSRHNSSYWKGKKYLGIGPGAHSYNKFTRTYNIANNNTYIYRVRNKEVFFEKEELTKQNIFDEYIITSLRTKWGCNIEYLKDNYMYDIRSKPFFIEFVKKGLVIIDGGMATLSKEGKFIADNIILEILYHYGLQD